LFDYCFKIYSNVIVLYDKNGDQLWYMYNLGFDFTLNLLKNILNVKWCILNYKHRYFVTLDYLKQLLDFRIKEKDKIFKIEYYKDIYCTNYRIPDKI